MPWQHLQNFLENSHANNAYSNCNEKYTKMYQEVIAYNLLHYYIKEATY